MNHTSWALDRPSSSMGRRQAQSRQAQSYTPPGSKRTMSARRNGMPHWLVAFSVAGQRDIVNVLTYARDERGAVNAAVTALVGMDHTLLWAFETLDRDKVQDLLTAAMMRERNAGMGRDPADEARARADIARFRRELTVLEQSRFV